MFEAGLLDEHLRPIDLIGRRQPHRFNVLIWGEAIPGFASQFERTVPASFFTAMDEGRVEVRCPCGSAQEFDVGDLHPCAGGCGRFYVWSGQTLAVANPTREVARSTS